MRRERVGKCGGAPAVTFQQDNPPYPEPGIFAELAERPDIVARIKGRHEKLRRLLAQIHPGRRGVGPHLRLRRHVGDLLTRRLGRRLPLFPPPAGEKRQRHGQPRRPCQPEYPIFDGA